MKRECRSCYHFNFTGKDADEPFGICRRFPPVWAGTTWSFPGMKPFGLCGEHETEKAYHERKEDSLPCDRLRGESGTTRPVEEGRGQKGLSRRPDRTVRVRKKGEEQ